MSDDTLSRTTSFFQLMKEPGFRIEIPKIQRDYAQGRDSAETLRTNFLQTIKSHLDKEKNLNLDFIYGSIDDDKFIPIDGQQRLTTLFLLHWYLGWASKNEEDFRGYLVRSDPNGAEIGNDSRFTYETRVSSRDFCNKLLTKEIAAIPDKTVSETVKNQPWFYLHWKNDPTIEAMLNTLDTIEKVFGDANVYYEQLVADAAPLITFQYIRLEDFGLTDQLYIKMNSRGKSLTAFENLKANIERIFKEHDVASGSTETAVFSGKIDREWTDLFWRYRHQRKKESKVDDLMMNFIRACVTNIAALEKGKKQVNLLRDNNLSFDYYLLQKVECDNQPILSRTFDLLDQLSDDKGNFKRHLASTEVVNEEALFESVIYSNLSFASRVQFEALVAFLDAHQSTDGIDEWMRLIRNLTENSRIEEVEEFINTIQTIHKLIPKAQEILTHIKDLKPTDFVGFSNDQAIEETFKAQLIHADPVRWEERIKNIENHVYLQGNIVFLLLSSGLIFKNEDGKYDGNFGEDLSEKFDFYADRLKATLEVDGFREYEGHLMRRALLSIDDYYMLPKGRNYSFLIQGFERDISWKRFLRTDRSEVLKQLFDKLDLSNIEGSMQSLVEGFEDKADWRYYFIKYPEMIEGTGFYKFIRWYDESQIYLLTKTQMNGIHYEYYSYALYIELQMLGYEVTYQEASFHELGSKYINSINGKEICISFWPYDPDDDSQTPGYWIEYEPEDIQEKVETFEEAIEWVNNYLSE